MRLGLTASSAVAASVARGGAPLAYRQQRGLGSGPLGGEPFGERRQRGREQRDRAALELRSNLLEVLSRAGEIAAVPGGMTEPVLGLNGRLHGTRRAGLV